MTERSREIHNAATGETVRFIRTADETGGELLVMEARWTEPGHVTPTHVHPTMEERWRVVEGELGFRIGDRELTARPGDTVIAEPGVRHENWNQGGVPAVMRIEMRPALRWEEFVRQLFALASESLEGDAAERSVNELLTEFAAEIELQASNAGPSAGTLSETSPNEGRSTDA
jgi:mannose-6-phosphate isomerase-like protein (cupin superfamily)